MTECFNFRRLRRSQYSNTPTLHYSGIYNPGLMKIGGLQKNSLIDYPGKLSCVVFLAGCNFACPYCHNPGLVTNSTPGNGALTLEELFAFLQERRGFLDGVVISGGEPLRVNRVEIAKGEYRQLVYYWFQGRNL